ncbi:hypothetical protein ACG02S_02160 [Roseateles sp. DC23W]|uniref:4'-phosphopantetheinyl transferase N-terminal domain-containing protein n=1 Tax=Pelomonas dachongensis TaxID=3299029 RepID=A0ABW7EGX2_9BURK
MLNLQVSQKPILEHTDSDGSVILDLAPGFLAVALVRRGQGVRVASAAENQLLGKSTERQRDGFLAGRHAAHLACLRLGIACELIGRGRHGEPLFPAALRGSISHSRTVAVAAVAQATATQAVGVDVDDERNLPAIAMADISWKSEVSRLQTFLSLSDLHAAERFAFSAKEAVFKCQFPLTQNRRLGFKQVSLWPLKSGEGLQVRPHSTAKATAEVLRRISVVTLSCQGHRVVIATANQ